MDTPDHPSNPSSRPPSPPPPDERGPFLSLPAAGGGAEGPPFKRRDGARILCLLLLPLLLCLTYWVPLRSTAPSREELRDALRSLDEAAYANSGCAQVAALLKRCEEQRCSPQYVYELKQLSRSCRTLSTKALEKCLLDSPGGRCVFEHLQSMCQRQIAEVLACAEAAMEDKLRKALHPPFAGPGGDGAAREWAAEVQRLVLAAAEEEPLGLLQWAVAGAGAEEEEAGGAAAAGGPTLVEEQALPAIKSG